MKGFFKSRFFTVVLIISIALCIFPTVLTAMGHGAAVKGAVVAVLSPFQRAASYVGGALGGYARYFEGYDRLEEENERLRAELESLREKVYDASIMEAENEWLREYLELKKINHTFTLADAKIVGRETTNTRTVYTFNKGTTAGIEKNMPVITKDGVVGYIIEAGLTWSKAVAITDQRSGVGVYTERTGALGVLCGSYELSLEKKCEIVCTQSDADIAVGDKVYTNGMGSLYPQGLSVGEVVEVYVDPYDRSLHAIVVPYVDFDAIDAVMVVVAYEAKGE